MVRIKRAETDFDAGLADDLNTAIALAAVFDLVRDANSAMDRSGFKQQDATRAVAAMEKFDAVLAVLADDDVDKLSKMGFARADARMPAEEVEARIEQRKAAKSARDFQRADTIRKELTDSGIILEDAKDGSVRWKYK
jgi:cysteinyl-tRNA synthetase